MLTVVAGAVGAGLKSSVLIILRFANRLADGFSIVVDASTFKASWIGRNTINKIPRNTGQMLLPGTGERRYSHSPTGRKGLKAECG